MNNLLSRRFESAFGSSFRAKLLWVYSLSLILALWFGATLAIDFVVMPSLANAGMMTSSDFIPAGFGRPDGIILVLLTQTQISHRVRLGVVSGLLFLIPLVYFYYLGPQMAGLGLTSDLTESIPATMNSMHYAYWILDLLKVSCVALYLSELWQVFDETAQA